MGTAPNYSLRWTFDAAVCSDIHRFFFDVGPQLGAKCFVGHHINRTAEQVFKIKLHTKITHRRGGAVKCNQDVHIAVRARGVARGGPEQGQIGHAKTLRQHCFVLRQKLRHKCSIQDVFRAQSTLLEFSGSGDDERAKWRSAVNWGQISII